MIRRASARWVVLAVLVALALGAGAQTGPGVPWASLRERAVQVLRTALAEEQEWVRVHAAEALLKHGYPEGVEDIFAPQVDTAPPKHRIGVWRVLARAQTTGEARETYVARIRAAFLDTNGPDRLHAVETLAKLGDTARPDELVRVAGEAQGSLQAYARWAVANSGDAKDEAAFVALLDSEDSAVRGGVAYGLRHLDRIQSTTLTKIEAALETEPADSSARVHMVSALYVQAPQEQKETAKLELMRYAVEGGKGEKYEAAAALGCVGDEADMPLLLELLADAEADVRISAADALLSIERRVHLQPIRYHETFEAECPPVTLWADDGPSKEEFIGLSEEQAFEGKRSLKVDVSIEGGRYHYYGAPLKVPCAGRAKLSARVFVAEGTTARVGFGANMVYPPTHHSGCAPVREFGRPTGGWELIEVDLVARRASGAARVMSSYTATARGEDVGAYLDRWSLFIYGGEGTRAIVYVDDVRVEGETPSEEDYEKEIEWRWAKGQQRLGKRIDAWRGQLADARETLDAMPETPESVQEDVAAVTASVEQSEALIDALAERGYAPTQEVSAIEAALFTARFGPETVAAIAKGLASSQPYLLYTPQAITNRQLATTTFPIPARVGRRLVCAGCRGEYESVTAAVYALEDLEELAVFVSNLSGPAGTIPAEAVDVHVVKCWYQAGVGIWPNTKVFVPELLLKDDALVRVDQEKEENYLRTTAEDGTESYLLCSGPTSEGLAGVRPIDTDELQPVDIPARSLKQFWLTVHIPQDAEPGEYMGTVLFSTNAGETALPIELTVLPFELLPSRLTYSIYYRAKLSKDGQPTIGSEYRSEQQYRAEIEDFFAHGVLYPANYQSWDEALLPRVLEIRREAGLPAGRFYTLGQSTGSPTTPAQLEQLAAGVKRWVDFCGTFGYDEVYFYGIDEAREDRLKAQRTAWRTVQEAGGKTFVACYKGTFEAMGELLNCAVLAGRPDPEEARKWHGVGSEAFCYAYPQVGNEEPETYRRNFGLVLWKAGFDGAMDYAYQHGFGHVWNDFDHKTYRDHNFTYPTPTGVVGTIQWEGFREAVDDVRYVTTLEHAIENAPAEKQEAAQRARRWLDGLDPDTADLYTARAHMVDLITELQ